ncbi:MAG TPA: class I SAM-dependent methyltransferase [Anaerolineaceae bacterium]|nr:class I SAM-dependent methyltransferase [Anaerolineaceae bacterium]
MKLPEIQLLTSHDWKEYQLLDSGDGRKLERYGKYLIIRPEPEAIWSTSLSDKEWKLAHCEFLPTAEKNGGHWVNYLPMEDRWQMHYRDLTFWIQKSASRHLGVFPEQATQWDWIQDQVYSSKRKLNVLNLFGYTGMASLAAARAGAFVTHLDASRKVNLWGQENQALSKISDQSIRWLVDDAFKFVKREIRRTSKYDGIILDPPKFGRGPKGEVWEFYKILPDLLDSCRQILSAQPVFLLITAYAIKASSLTLYYGLEETMKKHKGTITAGEVVLHQKNGKKAISMAIYGRWTSLNLKGNHNE